MIPKEQREADKAICDAMWKGVFSWEPHGNGWALYVNRGEPIDPSQPRGFCNEQHGYNILTVGKGGFDHSGEHLRAFIASAASRMSVYVGEAERVATGIEALKSAIEDAQAAVDEHYDPATHLDGVAEDRAYRDGLREALRLILGEV